MTHLVHVAHYNYIISEEAIEKLLGLFNTARSESDFANGRYVRNVIEKAKMAQATRLLTMNFDSIGNEDITTIIAEDIELPKARTKPKAKKSAFVRNVVYRQGKEGERSV